MCVEGQRWEECHPHFPRSHNNFAIQAPAERRYLKNAHPDRGPATVVSSALGESPVLLVGLVDGTVALVEVLKASVNLVPELQLTVLAGHIKGSLLEWKQVTCN